MSFFKRRYINASPTLRDLDIKFDSANGTNVATLLPIGGYTMPDSISVENPVSLVFLNADSIDPATGRPALIYEIDNLAQPIGKYFSIIFGNDRNPGYYNAVAVQEY